MVYDAFTIDTNIPIRAGLQLDSGLLAQLNQFKHGPLDFVLSEIVIRELRKHLVVQVTEAHDRLKAALTKAATTRLTKVDQMGWDAKFADLPEPASVAGVRLKDFLEATGASLIKANLASIDNLVTAYFGNGAPFESTGAKRNEFPDAIALLSLEAWAKSQNKRILAVSSDKGWKEFAESSKHIDVFDDLAQALEVVQEHSETARTEVAKWLTAASAGTQSVSFIKFTNLLRTSMSETPFYTEGSGHLCREGQGEDLQLVSFTIDQFGGNVDLSIVRLGSNEVAATVTLTVVANATASFSMAVWDSIDKEDVNMGYQSAEAEVEFDVVALLTFSRCPADAEMKIDLMEVEVLDGPGTVDFGEIEFDYGDDDCDDWLAEKPEGTTEVREPYFEPHRPPPDS
jgi:hypothetical protein